MKIMQVKSGWYYLVSKESGKFLDSGTDPKADMWEFTGSDRQQWMIKKEGDYYTLQVKQHGKFLDSGKGISIWEWNGSDRQYWKILDEGSGFYTLQDKEQGKFLDGSFQKVDTWEWTGSDRQYWRLFPVEEPLTSNEVDEDIDKNMPDVVRLKDFRHPYQNESKKLFIGVTKIPFFYVKDRDPAWQVKFSPYYKLSRYVFWSLRDFAELTEHFDYEKARKISVGYEKQTTRTIENTMSIEVVNEAKVEFKGVASAGLKRSFKNDLKVSSTSSEKYMTSDEEEYKIKKISGTRIAFARWHRCDEYVLESTETGDGSLTEIVKWSVISRNTFVDDTFPRDVLTTKN